MTTTELNELLECLKDSGEALAAAWTATDTDPMAPGTSQRVVALALLSIACSAHLQARVTLQQQRAATF